VHFWDGDLPRTSTLKLKRRQIRAALAATTLKTTSTR
jgi:acyl-coenzyme A synthetase/AMP-(fatty) acid ligase